MKSLNGPRQAGPRQAGPRQAGPRQARAVALSLGLAALLMSASCQPAAETAEVLGVVPLVNAALHKAVDTSGVHEGYSSVHAVDGDIATSWIVAESAGSWIEVDLGDKLAVHRIELVVEQTPEGETIHRILGKGTEESPYRELAVLEGLTSGGQVLTREPPAPWADLRLIKVETTRTPSWVGWKEIRVWSPG